MTPLCPVTLRRPVPGARAAGLLLALVLLAPALAPSIAAQESPLMQAMRDELTRAMTGLRIADQPAPYYIAYTLEDVPAGSMDAILGALVSDGRRRSRTVRVDVRVGDYARDSSRFVSFDRDPGVSSMYGMGDGRGAARRRRRRAAPPAVAGDRRRLPQGARHLREEAGGAAEPGQPRSGARLVARDGADDAAARGRAGRVGRCLARARAHACPARSPDPS